MKLGEENLSKRQQQSPSRSSRFFSPSETQKEGKISFTSKMLTYTLQKTRRQVSPTKTQNPPPKEKSIPKISRLCTERKSPRTWPSLPELIEGMFAGMNLYMKR